MSCLVLSFHSSPSPPLPVPIWLFCGSYRPWVPLLISRSQSSSSSPPAQQLSSPLAQPSYRQIPSPQLSSLWRSSSPPAPSERHRYECEWACVCLVTNRQGMRISRMCSIITIMESNYTVCLEYLPLVGRTDLKTRHDNLLDMPFTFSLVVILR